jgi:hypothetical protein
MKIIDLQLGALGGLTGLVECSPFIAAGIEL